MYSSAPLYRRSARIRLSHPAFDTLQVPGSGIPHTGISISPAGRMQMLIRRWRCVGIVVHKPIGLPNTFFRAVHLLQLIANLPSTAKDWSPAIHRTAPPHFLVSRALANYRPATDKRQPRWIAPQQRKSRSFSTTAVARSKQATCGGFAFASLSRECAMPEPSRYHRWIANSNPPTPGTVNSRAMARRKGKSVAKPFLVFA